MKAILSLILVALLVSSVSARKGMGLKRWDNQNGTQSKQIGGDVRNYEKPDKSWAQIKNDWKLSGDSAYVDESVLKASVDTATGASSVTLNWGGQDYVVSQKLMGIGWLKISTRGRQWIDNTMDWSNVSVDSNIVSWTNVSPAVDYRVRKSNGRVEHGIFFKPAFLDSAVTLYDQRPDSLDIALANVMVYTLSSNIDNADSGLGELSWRQLKSFGKYTFKLTDQRLRYAGSDTLQAVPVKQFWRKRNDSIFCIEYVMMSDVKQVHEDYPSVTIWHNDTKTIEGTTNVEDAALSGTTPDANYGGRTTLLYNGSNVTSLVRVLNVATELGAGATITDCSLYVYNTVGATSAVYGVLQVFKPWVEGDEDGTDDDDGDVTYNDWASDANEWTTEGVLCEGDDGSDNTQDNSACNAARRDRKSTAESTVDIDATNTLFAWDISNTLAQAWYDATTNENGVLIKYVSGSTELKQATSTEGASNQPHWVFTFTAGAAGEETEGIIHDIDGLKKVFDIDGVKKVHGP